MRPAKGRRPIDAAATIATLHGPAAPVGELGGVGWTAPAGRGGIGEENAGLSMWRKSSTVLVLTTCLFAASYGAAAMAAPPPDPGASVEASKAAAHPGPNAAFDPRTLLAAAISKVEAAAPIAAAKVAVPKLPRLKPPNIDLVYAIAAAVFALSVLGLFLIRGLLAKSRDWSLGDALSEEVELTDAQGTPIKVMRASASRLIAFSGLLVMLFLYFGFGMFLLYYFGTGQKVPQDVLDSIQKFMLAGLALFAPYAVNQFRAAMTGAPATAAASPKTPAPKAPPPAVDHAPVPQLAGPAQPTPADQAFQGGC
jgi:hypothetical protein